jgi:hypothetical protein
VHIRHHKDSADKIALRINSEHIKVIRTLQGKTLSYARKTENLHSTTLRRPTLRLCNISASNKLPNYTKFGHVRCVGFRDQPRQCGLVWYRFATMRPCQQGTLSIVRRDAACTVCNADCRFKFKDRASSRTCRFALVASLNRGLATVFETACPNCH